MAGQLKVVGIHGLGDHRGDPWANHWEQSIRDSLPRSDQIGLTFVPFNYDDIFERIEISTAESVRALWKLTRSGAGSLFRRRQLAGRRGIFDWIDSQVDAIQDNLRWTAGYVVAWLEDEEFRRDVRRRLLNVLKAEKPDVVLAHSLGSLISYDALTHHDLSLASYRTLRTHLKKMIYVSLGSQIGNPFVRANLTPGRIKMLPVKQWYHLYNSEDDVFTAPIRLPGIANFSQLRTYFDIEGLADHDANHYLRHSVTVANVWDPISKAATGDDSMMAAVRSLAAAQAPLGAVRKPRRRALLVGINDYPNPADRLHGCVNDVFLFSAVLQECAFEADDIRIVLNDRATAVGILERLHWLLDDVAPGDELVFYYSGHGAQLPTYGEGDQIDRMDETLVPWDFDWSPETCVTDDQIFDFYSQLPYDTKLLMMFDCCHSGGVHRDGVATIRGLTPPDDIRHRAMQWNPKAQMWVSRDLTALNPDFSPDEDVQQRFTGTDGDVLRIGRAMPLRQFSAKEYEAAKKRTKTPVGPYLPVILEACQEHEYAYEYRHGVESYGAFTYSMVHILRQRKRITFEELVNTTRDRLRELRYDQAPQLLGPEKIVKSQVPWMSQSK